MTATDDKALIPQVEQDRRIRAALDKEHLGDLQVGDVLIDSDGRLFRVANFSWKEQNSKGRQARVHLDMQDHHGQRPGWHHYGDIEAREVYNKYARLGVSAEQADAIPIQDLYDDMKLALADVDSTRSAETAIQVSGGAARAGALVRVLEDKRNRVVSAQRLIKRAVERAMHGIGALKKQLDYLYKVIEVGDLYLGLSETITVLREGPHAQELTPLVFMQRIRYMDEEVGIEAGYRDDEYATIRHDNIGAFDAWVLTRDNIDRLIPFERGVLALRPTQRQTDKANPWEAMDDNSRNRRIYLLVKNGKAIYRLTPALVIHGHLYPKLGEFEQVERAAKGERVEDPAHPAEMRDGKVWWPARTIHQEEAAKKVFDYKKVLALFQGLLDRANVLGPFPVPINFFDADSYADTGLIAFNRDAELAVSTGRPRFRDWQRAGNARLKPGDRVFLADDPSYNGRYGYGQDKYSSYGNHFLYFANNYPRPPREGVYPLLALDPKHQPSPDDRYKPKWIGRILYNPGDEVGMSNWEWNPHRRTKQISFRIEPNDPGLLNYDELTIAEIEAYIDDPTERRDYLEMLPVLFGVRKRLKAERDHEYVYATQLAEREKLPLGEVLDALRWWKNRTTIKRSLRDDDAKAWRMVIRKVRNKAWEGE